MSTGRREFLKRSVETAALVAAGATWPGCSSQAESPRDSGVTWRKAPCRFCGTGCGTLVGTQGGRWPFRATRRARSTGTCSV